MNRLIVLFALAYSSLAIAAVAPIVPNPATVEQTNAGVSRNTYISPYTLNQWTGGGGGGGGAPTNATYITQTPHAGLSAEQPLSLLSTGLMRVATTTGAVTSITDSAGIAANISDETGGGGLLVFSAAPTFTGNPTGVSRVAITVTQASHGLVAKDAVYDNNGTFTKGISTQADPKTSRVMGVVESAADANTFVLVLRGRIVVSGLTANSQYYLSDSSAGVLTTTAPSATTSNLVPVLVSASTTVGYVQIGSPASLALIDLTADVTGILPSTNGGSGSAFFQVAGLSASAKTFTFPNASATVLTSNDVVTGAQGGTGVNNSGKTITLGGNLTTSGANAVTFTTGGATNVTLPTTGTVATLGGSETLTNKTLTTPTISGAVTFPDGVRQTFNPDGTNAGLNVGAQAGDPSSLSNGDFWYNSSSNELKARINGSSVAIGAGGGTTADSQVFDTSGTWTKPAGSPVWVMVVCFGAGGGGGGAGAVNGGQGVGGGGGGGGARVERIFRAADLPSTVSVTVGGAGTSGAGGVADVGVAGGNGGNTTFGAFVFAGGGGGGKGGATTNVITVGGSGGGSAGQGNVGSGTSTVAGGLPGIGGALGNQAVGGMGGNGTDASGSQPGGNAEYGGAGGGGSSGGPNASAGMNGGSSRYGGAGGGAGGGVTNVNAAVTGGAGGSSGSYTAGSGAAAGTGSSGSAGTAGAASGTTLIAGGGGGGGGPSTGNTGGAGGAGGFPSGGGAGGGGAGGATPTGGAGGAGGAGRCLVITGY